MITNIALENFKCFRKVEINPRLITVFVGPNGSGKSSILQALALLKQSIGKTKLSLDGPLIHLGSNSSITPHSDESLENVQIRFGGVDHPRLTHLNISKNVGFLYSANFFDERLTDHLGTVEFRFEGQPINISNKSILDTVEQDQIGPYEVNIRYQRVVAQPMMIEQWKTDQPNPSVRSGIEHVMVTPKNVLASTRFLPAARGLVRPSYPLGDTFSEDIDLHGGLSRQEEQTATNLGYSRSLETQISEWLKKVTGVGLKTNIVPANRVEIQSLSSSGEVNIVAEGFGTNSLILLFLQLASAAKGATVMIEEPEIHLHPRAQANLATVLADEAKSSDKQIIMTTHSEHILGRLLTLVAENTLSADDLAIYSFEKDKQGVCTASELKVTEDGRVEGGLKDFFEPDLEELDRYIKALQSSE